MKHAIWWIILALLVIGGGWLIWKHIDSQNQTGSTDTTGSTADTGTSGKTKVLGSATTTVFPAGKKLYADTTVRVRSGPGTANVTVREAKPGELIGTTTGNEASADGYVWVKVTDVDDTLYVAKKYTYILQ